MKDQDTDREDELARLLEAFDEHLANPELTPDELEQPPADTDPELLARFEATKRCLLRLNHAWQSERLAQVVQPRELGRYQILRQLGFGSFGVVFLAEDPGLKRQVALKVSHPSWLLTEASRQRFLREAEAAARLSHPQIVTIFDVGQAGEVPYIAAEYCPGPNLEEWLESNPHSVRVREAAEFIASLADAVQHAHIRGVLHRDLKPSNVILCPAVPNVALAEVASVPLSSFVPKITDFGLAKLSERNDLATRSGTVIGTLSYAAPEQAEGRLADICVQSDVYALGTILYRMLTGAVPFHAETYAKTLQKVLFADPQSPDRVRPEVPADLAAICMKCLEKSPARRYASATDLAADLRRYCAGQQTLARPLSHLRQAWRWTQRHPLGTAQIAVFIGMIAAMIVGTAVNNARLRTATNIANQEMALHQKLLYTANVRGAYQAWRNENLPESLEFLSKEIPADARDDLRGFSWHYLWKTLHCELLTIRAHDQDVYSMAFSPDGRQLATTGKDRAVRLWDAVSGLRVCEFAGHLDEVNTVVFLSDDNLASASDDGTIRLWSVSSGKQVGILEPNEGRVCGLAASHDGKLLAAGGVGGRIHIWDVASRLELWSCEAPAIVESLSFSSDDQLLASANENRQFRCFNMIERKLDYEAQVEVGTAVSVAFSPNLPELTVAGRSNKLCVYRRDGKTWSVVADGDLDAVTIGIHTTGFAPHNNALATGNRNGTIQLWEVRPNLSPWRTLPGHSERVWSLAWSPDGRVLASGAADGTVKVWSPFRPAGEAAIYPSVPSEICSISISPDRRNILTGSLDGRLRAWNRHTRAIDRSCDTAPPGFTAGHYLRQENSSVAVATQGGLKRWNFSQRLSAIQGTEGFSSPFSCALSQDAKLLALGGPNGTAAIYGAEDLQLLNRFESRALSVRCCALSPDGHHLVTGGFGAEIELWNTDTGELEHLLPGHAALTRCLAFSIDGATIISGGSDRLVRLWDVASGRLLASLVGNSGEISALAAAPDGRTLATGTIEPPTVKLFDLRSNAMLMNLSEPVDPVSVLAFTADSRTLIAGCSRPGFGQLLEWSLDDHSVAADAGVVRAKLRPQPIDVVDGPPPPKRDVSAATCVELIQAVHTHALRSGYATGYPTFRKTPDGKAGKIQAVMFPGPAADTINVSLDEFSDRAAFPRTDYANDSELLSGLTDVMNRWARARGYVGALPTYYSLGTSNEPLRYEVLLLRSKHAKRGSIPLAELGDLNDPAAVFGETHAWAVKEGYLSGFPAFRLRGQSMECVLIRRKSAELVEISADELLTVPDGN